MILAVLTLLTAAQDMHSNICDPARPVAKSTMVPARSARLVPAGTLLQIAIAADIRSKTAKIGDHFAIRLAAPLIIDGTTILPTGTPGIGEVIHASPVRFMTNKPGELIVAARYLDIDGVRLPLAGLRINRTGGTGRVFTTAGPVTIADNADIPAGTTAVAKVAIDSTVPLAAFDQENAK